MRNPSDIDPLCQPSFVGGLCCVVLMVLVFGGAALVAVVEVMK